jgi:hypothetical protein
MCRLDTFGINQQRRLPFALIMQQQRPERLTLPSRLHSTTTKAAAAHKIEHKPERKSGARRQNYFLCRFSQSLWTTNTSQKEAGKRKRPTKALGNVSFHASFVWFCCPQGVERVSEKKNTTSNGTDMSEEQQMDVKGRMTPWLGLRPCPAYKHPHRRLAQVLGY